MAAPDGEDAKPLLASWRLRASSEPDAPSSPPDRRVRQSLVIEDVWVAERAMTSRNHEHNARRANPRRDRKRGRLSAGLAMTAVPEAAK